MKVKFQPSGQEFEIKPGQSVLSLAQEKGVFIKTVCNGVPNCAECRVRLVEGEDVVIPPNKEELSLIGSAYFVDSRRLSCQLQCFGDIVVDLSEQDAKKGSQGKKPRGFRGNSSRAKQDIVALADEGGEENGN